MAFVAPYVIVFVLGVILPLLYSAYTGFFENRIIGGRSFVGFSNYVAALSDHTLWRSYARVALYCIVQVPTMLSLALLAALMLDSGRIKRVAVPRLVLFLPYAVPTVIAALMWSYIYGARYGLIGQVWRLFDGTPPDMFSSRLILVAIGNIVLWGFLGYNMLIYYASLKAIPTELYESARIDGASELRIARSIKIPQIAGSLVMTLVFGLIGAFQLFNEPNMMQTLAPDVISSSFTPNMYSYNLAFAGQNVNYAAAVALIVGFITMGVISVTKLIGERTSRD